MYTVSLMPLTFMLARLITSKLGGSAKSKFIPFTLEDDTLGATSSSQFLSSRMVKEHKLEPSSSSLCVWTRFLIIVFKAFLHAS